MRSIRDLLDKGTLSGLPCTSQENDGHIRQGRQDILDDISPVHGKIFAKKW
jgi:hypothetical protein